MPEPLTDIRRYVVDRFYIVSPIHLVIRQGIHHRSVSDGRRCDGWPLVQETICKKTIAQAKRTFDRDRKHQWDLHRSEAFGCWDDLLAERTRFFKESTEEVAVISGLSVDDVEALK